MESSTDDFRHPGGSVEPANRDALPKERVQPMKEVPIERFELHDPFNQVTYRARTIDQIAAKADKVGATRFYAVAPDGVTTPVQKVDGEWKRGRAPEAMPQPTRQLSPLELRPAPLVIDMGTAVGTTPKTGLDAARAAHTERIEASLHERYTVKRGSITLGDVTVGRTVYHYRGEANRIAFIESMSRLVTNNNNPSVARSMVDVADLRKWNALRVFGHDDFRRTVWLEASLRGVKTVGYEPARADLALFDREREARQDNRLEQMSSASATTATKQSALGNGGCKAVLDALDAVLVASKVPAKQREAVMKAAENTVTRRLQVGENHKVDVYNKSGPPPRATEQPMRKNQRTSDRGPAR